MATSAASSPASTRPGRASARSPARATARSGHATAARMRSTRSRAEAEAVRNLVEGYFDQWRRYRQVVVGAIAGAFVLNGAGERSAAGTLEFHDLLVLARRLLAMRPDVPRPPARALPPRPARRVPGHRSDPAGDRRPPHRPPRRPARRRHHRVAAGARTPLRRRRPEAVDLPLPPGGHRHVPRRGRPARRRPRGALGELPLDRRRHHVGQRRLRPRHPARDQRAAGVRPARRLPAGPRDHGTVHVLGPDVHDDVDADALRWLEADSVGAAVVTALREQWPVGDGQGGLRPCRPDDIAVLLPARTSLPMLETVLSRLTIPYRAENSSVVYVTPEIRTLMLALRAAADPTDALALVAALRSPLYGCSDAELYDWTAGGRQLAAVRPSAGDAGRSSGRRGHRPRHLDRQGHRSVDPGRVARPHRRRTAAVGDGARWTGRPRRVASRRVTSSTRHGRGPTPAGVASGGTCAGRPTRRPRAGRATRSCPSATTTPCG